jgi:hypothetical protein
MNQLVRVRGTWLPDSLQKGRRPPQFRNSMIRSRLKRVRERYQEVHLEEGPLRMV